MKKGFLVFLAMLFLCAGSVYAAEPIKLAMST